MLIYGKEDIAIVESNNIKALIYSNKKVTLGKSSHVTGAVSGMNVTIETDSTITYDAASVSNNELGGFCVAGPSTDHFDIDHNGSAILCVDTTVTVTAEDVGNATDTGYTGTITLNSNSTASNKGDWSLLTGGGSFSNGIAGDGVATYSFVSGDNGIAVFSLDTSNSNTTLPLNLSVADGSIVDDDLEGPLNLSADGFTVTGSALVQADPIDTNLPIANQVAGTDFDVFIAAYGQTATDPDCGIIEAYNGNKTLILAASYIDPGSGTITPTFTATPTPFSAGQAQVSVKYKDAGKITLDFTEGSVSGSSQPFVVTPARFAIALEDTPPSASDDSSDKYRKGRRGLFSDGDRAGRGG